MGNKAIFRVDMDFYVGTMLPALLESCIGSMSVWLTRTFDRSSHALPCLVQTAANTPKRDLALAPRSLSACKPCRTGHRCCFPQPSERLQLPVSYVHVYQTMILERIYIYTHTYVCMLCVYVLVVFLICLHLYIHHDMMNQRNLEWRHTSLYQAGILHPGWPSAGDHQLSGDACICLLPQGSK